MVLPLIPAFLGLVARLEAPAAMRAVAGGAARVAANIADGAARGISRSVVGGARAISNAGRAVMGGAAAGAVASRGQSQQTQTAEQEQGDPSSITADVSDDIPQPLQLQVDSNQSTKVAQGEGGNVSGKLTDSPLTSLLRSIDNNVRSIRQTLEARPVTTDDDRRRIVKDREKDPASRGVSLIAGMIAGFMIRDFVENFRERVDGIVTAFGNGLNSVVSSIADVINNISSTVGAVFTSIGESISQFFGGLLNIASGAQARAEAQAEQGRSELTPRMADGAGNPGQAAAAALGRNNNVPTPELGDVNRMLEEPESNETAEMATQRQAADADYARIVAETPNGNITIPPESTLGQYIEARRTREAEATEAASRMTPEERARTQRENEVLQNNHERSEAPPAQEGNAVTRWFDNARDVLTGRNLERSREQARVQADQERVAQITQRQAAEMVDANARVPATEAEANGRVVPAESYSPELQANGPPAAEGDEAAMNRVLERLSSMTGAQQAPQITVVQTPAAPPQVVPVPVGQNGNSPQAPGAGGPITTPRSHPSTMGEPPSPAAPRR